MRKFLFSLLSIAILSGTAHAAKLPSEVTEFVTKSYPGAEVRFDGVILLPDNTVYLPIFPAPMKDVEVLEVQQTYPEKTPFYNKPDIVIFNNDFSLVKVITDSNGKKTILKMDNPPAQIKNGLLPQDMLVPRGLIIPENIKSIMGNLKIDTKEDRFIRINPEKNDLQKLFPIKNKFLRRFL